jgi:hypothetical protein
LIRFTAEGQLTNSLQTATTPGEMAALAEKQTSTAALTTLEEFVPAASPARRASGSTEGPKLFVCSVSRKPTFETRRQWRLRK